MPWLEKDKVLFIHVPRCGGTSITKHHRVGEKAQEGKNLFYRIGIKYYYYRYRLLETANFPFMTWENLIAVLQFTLACFLFYFFKGLPVPYVMWTMCTLLFVNSTLVFTAPIMMRTDICRRGLMFFLGRVMCGWGSDTNYLIGTNEKAYLFHLTAERCIRYGYVSEQVMKKTSFSIVRNPYSRAVSMYEYNKRAFESFEHFVRDFHQRGMKHYHKLLQTDSKHIYCHVLPMHEYTHLRGRQVVNTIIKQEHLKRLVGTDWKDSGVPVQIQEALTGIPHANSRKRKVPWQQYYTQETMDLVLEMYEKDFDIFGYDKFIPTRDDLIPKIKTRATSVVKTGTSATRVGTMLRESISLSDRQAILKGDLESPESEVHDSSRGAPMATKKSPVRGLVGEDRLQQRRSSRRVSIVDKVETKFFEDSVPEDTSLEKKSLKMPDYESQVEIVKDRLPARRATCAGEGTSEFSDRYEQSSSSKLSLHENLTDMKTVADSFSFERPEDPEKELFRKKRSASAFVLHVQ